MYVDCLVNSLYVIFPAAPKVDWGSLLSRDISVRAGEPILIDIPITGSPTPTAAWKKNDSDLAPSSRVSLWRDTKLANTKFYANKFFVTLTHIN